MPVDAKIKLSTNRVIHYIYFFLVIAVIFIIYFISMFLYKNFYITITQSEVVVILKKDIASEVVDMNKFKQIIGKIQKKKQPHEIKLTADPFK